MPIGRIILKSISKSKKLSKTCTPSDSACLLYTWLIPHLDINGCYYADPRVVNGDVWPRRGHMDDFTEQCLKELEGSGLIITYETNGDKFLIVPDFVDKQPNLRPDKEGKPSIPTPTPEQLQSKSGVTQELPLLSKVKISKVNICGQNDESAGGDIKKNKKAPTKAMCSTYQQFWSKHHEGHYMFTGADGKVAQQLWAQCKRECPNDPLGFFNKRCEMIMTEFGPTPYVSQFRGLSSMWNRVAAKKKPKGWIDS